MVKFASIFILPALGLFQFANLYILEGGKNWAGPFLPPGKEWAGPFLPPGKEWAGPFLPPLVSCFPRAKNEPAQFSSLF